MILAGRRTVVAMAAAAGLADQFGRACWLFSGAAWDIGDLGLAVARLIVQYLVPAGEPVTVAVGGTLFRRWGRKVFISSPDPGVIAVAAAGVLCAFPCVVDALPEHCLRRRSGSDLLVAAVF